MTVILRYLLLNLAVFTAVSSALRCNLNIISRKKWGARPPKRPPTHMPPQYHPAPITIVHHSALDNNCSGKRCAEIVREYQDLHMDINGWDDIGYNFLIDPRGRIYKGRGWGIVGAQAKGYNVLSHGICMIGNFEEIKPTKASLRAAKNLIQWGIWHGHIQRNYTLYGHQQVRNTLCPGKNLFSVIKTWPHFRNTTL